METYDEIYQRMKSKYIEESGSEFDEKSDIAIRLRVLAGEIYNAATSMEWLRRQMFVTTASGEFLDEIAEQRGLERKGSRASTGSLTFIVSEPLGYDVVIPEGTVAATQDIVPIRFYTTETVVLGGAQTSVNAQARAELDGALGNVNADTVTVSVSVPQEIEEITNLLPFTDGREPESDSSLRERIRDTYVNRANGANSAYYRMLAMSVEGVEKVGIIPRLHGANSVGVYVCGNRGTVSQSVLDSVRDLVTQKRELLTDITVENAALVAYDLDVTISPKIGYSIAEATIACRSAFEEYINSLPAGAKLYLSALGKRMLETGTIDNYEFDAFMENRQLAGSQCFKPGNITIRTE